MPLFLLKFLVPILSILGIGLTLSLGISSWKSSICEQERLQILAERQAQEAQRLREQNRLLEEAHQKMQEEVAWARHYVQKQEKAIEDLKADGPEDLRECLDLRIGSDFLR